MKTTSPAQTFLPAWIACACALTLLLGTGCNKAMKEDVEAAGTNVTVNIVTALNTHFTNHTTVTSNSFTEIRKDVAAMREAWMAAQVASKKERDILADDLSKWQKIALGANETKTRLDQLMQERSTLVDATNRLFLEIVRLNHQVTNRQTELNNQTGELNTLRAKRDYEENRARKNRDDENDIKIAWQILNKDQRLFYQWKTSNYDPAEKNKQLWEKLNQQKADQDKREAELKEREAKLKKDTKCRCIFCSH